MEICCSLCRRERLGINGRLQDDTISMNLAYRKHGKLMIRVVSTVQYHEQSQANLADLSDLVMHLDYTFLKQLSVFLWML